MDSGGLSIEPMGPGPSSHNLTGSAKILFWFVQVKGRVLYGNSLQSRRVRVCSNIKII